eukprot:TRINITY_DN36123_c0_g1_i1.p1 TRINITY_DN36123_c0_g1~~TRINITY_DN36123_c0_g1_i1.p1  ORF type:complete len:293 (+),score=17.18 TRINITY_DN36123_c0_g1_i1:304-1182(+)
MHFVSEPIMRVLVHLVLWFGAMGCMCCLSPGGPVGIVLICCVILVAWFFLGRIADFVSLEFGTAIVFLCTYFCVRAVVSLRDQHITSWPYVSEVSRDSEEFREQLDYFTASCLSWEHKYDFKLRLHRLLRVDRPGEDGRLMQVTERSRRLFHGTKFESARGIVSDGFRLPAVAGMFGKGIYFADCPLKSWRYCFPSAALSISMPKLMKRGGLIFLCWVDLGTQREQKGAQPGLAGYKKTWWGWLRGHADEYDSVVGLPEEQGGALRAPEYVVYKPEQVKICYLCEVLQERAS